MLTPNPRSGGRKIFHLLFAVGLYPFAAAQAQIPQEIPLTDRIGVGARAMGMAGAFVSIADDATALYYNPAGLARVERIELSVTFTHHRVETTTMFLDGRAERDLSPTRISQLGFVYPFPTYRGSFVIGMGFHRLTDLDRDYFRSGSGAGVPYVEESIFEEGSLGAWTAGLAWDASPRVSLGLAASILTGSSYREYFYGRDGARYGAIDDLEIAGLTGSVGAMVRVGDAGRFGLNVELPKDLDFDGLATDIDSLGNTADEFFFEDDMTLPFSISAGLAWRFGPLLAAGDLQFIDWTQIDYFGPLRTPPPGAGYAYRQTLAVRAGAEWTPAGRPLRLRMGLARDPVPYRLILTEASPHGFDTAEFSPDRWEWSAGAGILLEESFTLDLAYTRRWFEREGTGIIEETTENKLFVGAAFRF